MINKANISFEEVTHCMLWINCSTLVVRDPETLSLTNHEEAAFAVEKVIVPLVAAIGVNNMMLTSPYRGQVHLYHNNKLTLCCFTNLTFVGNCSQKLDCHDPSAPRWNPGRNAGPGA